MIDPRSLQVSWLQLNVGNPLSPISQITVSVSFWQHLVYSWHSPLSQYSQLGVAVQLAPGFAAQNAVEQSLPGAGGGGVGGEGAAQGDGKGTLKV